MDKAFSFERQDNIMYLVCKMLEIPFGSMLAYSQKPKLVITTTRRLNGIRIVTINGAETMSVNKHPSATVEWHVKQNNYTGRLATMVELLNEAIYTCDKSHKIVVSGKNGGTSLSIKEL